MRALSALLLLLLAPTIGHAAERRLTGDQLRDLARREMVWCENYRAAQKDCDALVLVSLLPDGSLQETGALRIASSPDLVLVIDGRSRIEGDRICSVYEEDTTKLAVLLNGQPVPAMASRPVEAVVRESMAEFTGKTLCQSFYADGDPARLREEVTVNGARRPDLESTYRLQADEAGLNLRTQDRSPDESRA